jgi:DNA-binding GntR family transcriptional regulator
MGKEQNRRKAETGLGKPLRSALQAELVARISALIRTPSHGVGARLRELGLSRELGVSRTPVRAALQHLVAEGVVEAIGSGGYAVLRIPAIVEEPLQRDDTSSGLYGRMLRDIILDEMPDPATESGLMRRYAVGRGAVLQAVKRLMREGLAEPLPGRGWVMLKFNGQQLARGYHLRSILEPAMLLHRDYVVPRQLLEGLQADHKAALEHLSPSSPWKELFELDARFHETLAQGSENELIVDIVRRQNRLRRLAEYVSYSRLERIRESMTEHMAVMEALLLGDAELASALLRKHLAVSRNETEDNFARDLDAIRAEPAKLDGIR